MASFIPTLTPDIPEDIKGNQKAIGQFFIDFSMVKICHKATKLGKNVKYMYEVLDEDGDGNLEVHEIMNGLRDKFNIFFGQEESDKLSKFMENEKVEGGGNEKSRLFYLWNNYAEK